MPSWHLVSCNHKSRDKRQKKNEATKVNTISGRETIEKEKVSFVEDKDSVLGGSLISI
jgi:hypothetical protein